MPHKIHIDRYPREHKISISCQAKTQHFLFHTPNPHCPLVHLTATSTWEAALIICKCACHNKQEIEDAIQGYGWN